MPNSNLQFGDVTGNVSIAQVGNIEGDFVARDKITNVYQQPAQRIIDAPYKFLDSYELNDQDIFFGRKAVIEKLLGELARHKTLVLSGRSGSGKTSLINAGLLPRLIQKNAAYVSFHDYSDRLAQLRRHLRDQGPTPLTLFSILEAIYQHHAS
jgi:ABC-type bacteriocin/lantibiotic exporter with double-glycine peptidase domain